MHTSREPVLRTVVRYQRYPSPFPPTLSLPIPPLPLSHPSSSPSHSPTPSFSHTLSPFSLRSHSHTSFGPFSPAHSLTLHTPLLLSHPFPSPFYSSTPANTIGCPTNTIKFAGILGHMRWCQHIIIDILKYAYGTSAIVL